MNGFQVQRLNHSATTADREEVFLAIQIKCPYSVFRLVLRWAHISFIWIICVLVLLFRGEMGLAAATPPTVTQGLEQKTDDPTELYPPNIRIEKA